MLPNIEVRSLLSFGTMPALDRVDLELLAVLAEDPRTTIVALAETLGLSRNTIQARMARLEQTGVFLSYERSFSPEVLGFPLQAFVSIGLRQTELPPHHRRACAYPRSATGARPQRRHRSPGPRRVP